MGPAKRAAEEEKNVMAKNDPKQRHLDAFTRAFADLTGDRALSRSAYQEVLESVVEDAQTRLDASKEDDERERR